MKNGETQIRLKRDTAETLRRAGRKGESYDDIIQRLIPKRLRRPVRHAPPL